MDLPDVVHTSRLRLAQRSDRRSFRAEEAGLEAFGISRRRPQLGKGKSDVDQRRLPTLQEEYPPHFKVAALGTPVAPTQRNIRPPRNEQILARGTNPNSNF